MSENKLIILLGILFLNFSINAQCYSDNCDDDNDIPIPGCCTATTAGMTWSGYGDIDCVNMGTGIPDVWVSFTAPTTGYIDISIDNLTQNGQTQFAVFDHQNAEVCSSLNSFGILAGYGCASIPGDGAGGTVLNQTVQYAVEAGERYWVLVSADVTVAGTNAGTFEICIDVTPLPPPPPPAPGQDCPDAQVLCNENATGFTIGNLQLGDGAIEENWGCILNEQNSQWYTFTASQSGTFAMNVDPVSMYSITNCAGGAGTLECSGAGDDYDFLLVDVTTTGCASTAPILGTSTVGCDYSACQGSTGFGNSFNSFFGLNASTQLAANDICDEDQCGFGPGVSCAGAPQWNPTTVNLVAGNTYALMIQNYTGSTGGVNVQFAGTAIIGPTEANASFTSILTNSGCEADLSLGVTAIPNYIYDWDFGDGSTYTGSNPPDHYYSTAGTYIVKLTVTDPLGCLKSTSLIIDVSACTPLPIGLTSFKAEQIERKVELTWATSSEANNDYFTVERSINGYDWQLLGTVDGAGNSTTMRYYSLSDESPYFPVTYYRLKQTDFDGQFSYSDVVSMTNETLMVGELISDLSPNPAKDYLNFTYSGNKFDTALDIFVLNELGQVVKHIHFDEISKSEKISFSTDDLEKGIYHIRVQQNDKIQNQKFAIVR